jgi:membrane fusion protein, multidrug efflux system
MAKILAANLRRVGAGLALVLLAPALSACNDDLAGATQRPAFVRTEIVRPQVRQTSVTLTGEVQARFRADLAFRVSGRVVERLVEVGAHVDAGQVLARLDPAEQKADVDAATAAAAAAQSQLRVATATFERQKALLSNGFTTRVVFDQAQEEAPNRDPRRATERHPGRPWLARSRCERAARSSSPRVTHQVWAEPA